MKTLIKQKILLQSLIFSTCLLITPLFANDIADLKKQLQAMQQQMQQMQAKIEEQEQRLKEQQQVSSNIAQSDETMQNSDSNKSITNDVVDSLEVNGEIAVVSRSTNSHEYNNNNASDIILDTLALGFDAQITSWVNGHMYFLYNQDPGPGSVSDELHVDEASITIGNSEISPFYLTAGRMYLPFGNYETNMVSDPITLILGETREEAIQVGMDMDNGFYGSAFLFNGRVLKQEHSYSSTRAYHIDNYGINLGYAIESGDNSFDLGFAYINNIATSDALQGAIYDNETCANDNCIDNYIGGISLHAIANIGNINLIGEYVSALDDFKAGEISSDINKKLKPSAWNIEAAYNYVLFGKDSSIAIAYQGSSDFYLDPSDPDIYDRAWLLGFNMDIYKNTTVSLEWRHAQADSKFQDIINADGSDYEDEDRIQLKMSVAF